MSDRTTVGSPSYRSMGLLANPFTSSLDEAAGWAEPATFGAAMRLACALERGIEDGRSRPIWVDKAATPGPFIRRTVAAFVKQLSDNDEMGLLVAFVPFHTFRIGRVRSSLVMLSGRISSPGFGRTLGAFLRDELATPDPALCEELGIDPSELARWAEERRDDPEAIASELFGAFSERRPGAAEMEEMIRETSERINAEAPEPEESEQSPEYDVAAPAVVASEPEAEAEHEPTFEERVGEYALRKAGGLSPVLGRALRVYRDAGRDAMSQEMLVTKAPRKTVRSLVRFASHRFRRTVLMYEQLEGWSQQPQEMRSRTVGILSELRWSLDPDGVMVFVSTADEAPELQEQFGAEHVSWDLNDVLAGLRGEEPAARETVERVIRMNMVRPEDALSPQLQAVLDAGEPSRFSTRREQLQALSETVEDLAVT